MLEFLGVLKKKEDNEGKCKYYISENKFERTIY
jgi:hypothetical protein